MSKKRSNFQNKSELLAVRGLLGAIGALPLETSMRFGKSLGRFLGSRFPKLQKTARRNLDIAFPEMPAEEKDNVVKDLAIINLERNNCIDELDRTFLSIIKSL